VKDIVAESASTYISILHQAKNQHEGADTPTAFSLEKFIPLLQDRITVLNPYTRMFLVGWITLLDSIPDLELVSYLPSFLAGLFRFLSDPNPDVHTATQVALERFLNEIKKIARLKRGIAAGKSRSQQRLGRKRAESDSENHSSDSESSESSEQEAIVSEGDDSDDESLMSGSGNGHAGDGEEDWTPGQDVRVDYNQILEIMVAFLGGSSGTFRHHTFGLQMTIC
jgi:vacuole morphology and inheritance protein 14